MKRVTLFYSQRPLNKGSTKVLTFLFAIPCKARGFQNKQDQQIKRILIAFPRCSLTFVKA